MDDVAKSLDRMSQIEVELLRIKADEKEDLARIKRDAAKKIKRLQAEKNSLKAATKAYMGPKRESLTSKWGQKSIELFSGVVGWKLSTVKVTIKRGFEKTVADALVALGLGDCVEIKTTYKFNRSLIRRYKDKVNAIDGLAFVGGKRESFYVDTDATRKKAA